MGGYIGTSPASGIAVLTAALKKLSAIGLYDPFPRDFLAGSPFSCPLNGHASTAKKAKDVAPVVSHDLTFGAFESSMFLLGRNPLSCASFVSWITS